MTEDEDAGRRQAELDYVTARTEERLADIARGRAAHGSALTPEDVDRIMGERADLLRVRGNGVLADRHVAAWHHFDIAQRALDEVVREVQSLGLPISPTQRARLDAATNACSAAEEDFERADAQATAWLDQTDEKGDR